MNVNQKSQANTSSTHKNSFAHNESLLLSTVQSMESISDKSYKALQTLRSAQTGVRLSNKTFIDAVEQYLKHLRNETNKQNANGNDSTKDTTDNSDKISIAPFSKTTGTSLERTVEDMVTFEFVEKVRKSFAEADADSTGYLDVSEFTAFMRRTYPDITDRQARIVFMKFQFFPGLSRAGKALDQIDYTYGRYISITRNGIVSHWSMSLKLIRESKIQSIEQRKQSLPLWITCSCVLPDMNYFAIATTERDLIFYDINSHTYAGSIIINYFPASLTTIDYRMNIKNSSQSTIFCGDLLGNLFIFQAKDQYRPMFHISDLAQNNNNETGSMRNYSFPRIVNNEYLTVSVTCFCNLHNDWIVQVKWIDDLDLFVSCALTSKQSLYIGDLNKKMEKYAVAKKGFAAFDYCKAHRTIVTGSYDGVIRFWDPFVTERATATLRGHNYSVTHLVVDNRENHIISIDKGKNIIIWDVHTLKIIQRMSHTILDLSEQDLTVCCLNPTQQRLIIGNKKLISLSHINESYIRHERTSHLYPITQILYNPLFDVIISCDEGSTINIWNILTGEKVMHILNAHVTEIDEYIEHAVEITAMCLDEAKRRLITGAHDGSLALWNFNNGHNLYRVNSNLAHAKEITALLHENERLFVAGWSRRIRVFHLGKSVVLRQVDEFRSLHNDDILSMSMMMNILATASYDGDIILWTIETGMPFMKLNSFEDVKPKLISLSWLYKQTTKGAIQAILPKYFSRRRKKNFKRHPIDNTERIRQSLLNRLRTNYETSVESVLKPDFDYQFNQSTISSDYHLDQLIFLHRREVNPSSATLITAGSMGWIWWWSIHVIGRLIAVFNGARKSQGLPIGFCFSRKRECSCLEHVLAMCVNEKCNILFTSDTAGYVAVWFIGDYACKLPDSKEKQMKLNEEKNQILTHFSSRLHANSVAIQEMKNQAEQKLRDHMGTPAIGINQDRATFLMNTVIYPQLLVAYRAHVRPITSIGYADDREIVITSSIDCTIRLFTLAGRYIGYMGQPISWGPLSSTIVLKDLPKEIPEDIRRVGSATTLELLRGDVGKRWKLLKHTIVAWTSLPIFRYFYQSKNSETEKSSVTIQTQSTIHDESTNSSINNFKKVDNEEKQEWIKRRERLRQIIKYDSVDFIPTKKKISVESMLKTQRENFGITMPILGQFTRKYMQHRPISNFDHIQIHGGKAIIYSLLPLASSSLDGLQKIVSQTEEIQTDILFEYDDRKLSGTGKNEFLQQKQLNGHSMTRPNEVFLSRDQSPKNLKNQYIEICPSMKVQTNTFPFK
ncbi:unnamed protein product [Rotaria socialis]|uniref:WD repeat-containing protein on Y chromosome n=1 Tax=Rotaria socialis TaxID=392032 RepID=A0A817TG05_9BILA|nr:unnamed protein product [Rotaria socialis]